MTGGTISLRKQVPVGIKKEAVSKALFNLDTVIVEVIILLIFCIRFDGRYSELAERLTDQEKLLRQPR